RAIPCANGGTRRIRTSASGAQASPATPSSSIQGMSSGRTPTVPASNTLQGASRKRFSAWLPSCAFDAVRPVTSEHQQRRIDLFGPLHDHLKRLADEDLG